MNSTERRNITAASLDDLDLDAIRDFLSRRAPSLLADDIEFEEALRKLQLVSGSGSRVSPTVAGLYVFGQHPQWLLPQLGVVAADFDGRALSDPVEARAHIEGPLPSMVDKAVSFVQSNARAMVNQIDPERSDLEFPMTAVREAIVNALVHRDLNAGGQVAVRLFEDRCEIWSPGSTALPRDIEHYLQDGGVSMTRNPLVAYLARRLGLAEQLGRGLPTIRRSVRESIHGEVEISSDKEGVLVVIPSGLHTRATSDVQMAN
ncbi:MAG: ATP-binding protein [Myxococcota bacterium]